MSYFELACLGSTGVDCITYFEFIHSFFRFLFFSVSSIAPNYVERLVRSMEYAWKQQEVYVGMPPPLIDTVKRPATRKRRAEGQEAPFSTPLSTPLSSPERRRTFSFSEGIAPATEPARKKRVVSAAAGKPPQSSSGDISEEELDKRIALELLKEDTAFKAWVKRQGPKKTKLTLEEYLKTTVSTCWPLCAIITG